MNGLFPTATQPLITRPIRTPDGGTQIVPLQRGWWACLDWLIAERGHTLERMVQCCWAHVQEYPQDLFMDVLENHLHCLMSLDNQAEFNLANDNFLDPNFVWEKPPDRFQIKLKRSLSFCPG